MNVKRQLLCGLMAAAILPGFSSVRAANVPWRTLIGHPSGSTGFGLRRNLDEPSRVNSEEALVAAPTGKVR